MVGRCCARLASITFISRVGFSTTTLALVLDSLVRVSRRVGKNHFDKVAQGPSSRPTPGQRALVQAPSRTASGIKRLHLVSASAQVARIQASQGASLEYISTGSASTISGLLTFFPKCFSSFLHSTCSLSVSYLYLALEEVYLPLGAPVSRYTTLWANIRLRKTLQTGLSPSLAVRSWTLLRLPIAMTMTLQITIRRTNARRLPVWAFPASVARTKGILVSFFSSA